MRKLQHIRHLLAAICLLHVSIFSIGQNNGRNYIWTRQMTNAAGSASTDGIAYYDGLGRQTMTQQKGITPSGASLYTMSEYDAAGRVSKVWMPVSSSSYVSENGIAALAAAQYGSGEKPYTKYIYEPSPASRVVTVYGPGSAWMDRHGVNTGYGKNRANEVNLYTVSTSGSLSRNGYYAAGTLCKVTRTDEDGMALTVYIDNIGNKVLERRDGSNDTYYIYDDRGNLSHVLQPEYQNSGSVELHAYRYTYDGCHRCTKKTFPGGYTVSYTYDLAGKMIFSQDSNQKTRGERTFFVYDSGGRTVLEGICADNTSLGYVSNIIAASSTAITNGQAGYFGTGYSYTNVNISPRRLLNAYYYDIYSFRSLNGFSDTELYPDGTGYSNAKGLLTGMITAVDDNTGNAAYSYQAFYYDDFGSIKYAVHKSHDNIRETTSNEYSFTRKPVKRVHNVIPATGTAHTETVQYTYDAADRLKTVTHRLDNGGTVTINSNTYDGLCRLQRDSRNGNSRLCTTYSYNIRNWTTAISTPLFTENIYYEAPVQDGATVLYNGNISSMSWRGAQGTSSQTFHYSYDGLGRLLNSHYVAASGNQASGRYDESMSYDGNGNILDIVRNGKTDDGGFGIIDDLVFSYNGDRIVSVTDDASDEPTYSGAFHYRDRSSASVDRTYDANGNMTMDLDKDIQSIEYNSQNMPLKVLFGDGSTISYVYDANGNKLQKTACINKLAATMPATEVMQGGNASDFLTTTTRYVGNFVYENGTLSHILTDNGYVNFHTGSPQYRFYIKDHLGNNRIVADANGSVIQQNTYYALGGLMADQCINAETQPYKYNGKELDRMHGLDTYDYGARHYDAAIGRWMVMDPLAEENPEVSPYAYCLDNPVNAMDPDGKEVVIWYKNKQGQDRQFVFTGFHGKNFIIHPKDKFVKDFLQAYMYNVKNGGGNMMQEAVLNKKYRIYVDDAANLAEPETNFSPGRQPTIHWESRKGLKTSHGGKQSPATRLEHEFDHAVDNINNSLNHRIKREQKDKQYGNKEEKRVITGSESKTAKANKEDIRDDHFGEVYDVSNPTKIY